MKEKETEMVKQEGKKCKWFYTGEKREGDEIEENEAVRRDKKKKVARDEIKENLN